MRYQLHVVRIFSFDWERSFAFYKDTLGLPSTFADRDLGWAQFDLGGASLGLEWADPDDAEARGLVGRFVGISLQVDDIDAAYAELSTRGVRFLAPPEPQIWGGVLAHFQDPSGNILTLLGRRPG